MPKNDHMAECIRICIGLLGEAEGGLRARERDKKSQRVNFGGECDLRDVKMRSEVLV